MSTDILNKIYPGIANINERITAEAAARANALLQATHQLAGYVETTFRHVAVLENA